MKGHLQMILTSLISLTVVFSIVDSQHYRLYAEEKDGGSHSNNPLVPIADNNNIFGNLAKQFSSFTKQFEYTVDLKGNQIFPNDTIKQDIVTNYKSSNYNISSLKYRLLGFDISASDIRIHVNPSKIDTIRTKIDFPLVFARDVSVTNGLINLKYGEINLGSIYGIYDKTTDKITMHIPINIALQYLPHNI
jgi:hypothetical protein